MLLAGATDLRVRVRRQQRDSRLPAPRWYSTLMRDRRGPYPHGVPKRGYRSGYSSRGNHALARNQARRAAIKKAPLCRAFPVRPRGLEPPRAIQPTRPSTLDGPCRCFWPPLDRPNCEVPWTGWTHWTGWMLPRVLPPADCDRQPCGRPVRSRAQPRLRRRCAPVGREIRRAPVSLLA